MKTQKQFFIDQKKQFLQNYFFFPPLPDPATQNYFLIQNILSSNLSLLQIHFQGSSKSVLDSARYAEHGADALLFMNPSS